MRGKYLFVENRKLQVRGVTYGSFRPGRDGVPLPAPGRVSADFAAMRDAGVNALRTYTAPPRWLLDIALEHDLFVMVGLAWTQHVAFLDDRRLRKATVEEVRRGVRACAGHPAVLCYSIGNEIPAPIVRWHGPGRVETHLRLLDETAREEDPAGLVTYVNYPTTEYLQLPFVDLHCFNVYLEHEQRYREYLAHLQNLVGDRPLVLTEIGLDSLSNGERAQAETVASQLRTSYQAGCAGAFVFSWTDEWHRGGHDVEDWRFGLVDAQRRPKQALASVAKVFTETPFHPGQRWPRISVVVCTYNGAAWLPGCLDALRAIEYPNFEVVIVNDGSIDHTEQIAHAYGFRVVTTPNRGLSSARNEGLAATDGEIVAYLDDDARPDPQWLTQLAIAFMDSTHAGIGGPNIAPPDDGLIAECVANAPGGPIHVLLDDLRAEHIPGCNMAFRREALEAVGGFDPRFRIAGDDVDLCWRVRDRGETLGFAPGAVVWHHRRGSIRAYLRQQREYGRAEGLLERKWPQRFNRLGHLRWSGHVYGGRLASRRGTRIRYGRWGTELFQSIYQPSSGTLSALASMPEWYLVIALLLILSMLGAVWPPLLAFVPLLVLAMLAVIGPAISGARAAALMTRPPGLWRRIAMMGVTALLHLLQPVARLVGRLRVGLAPWRRRARPAHAMPRIRLVEVWSERADFVHGWLERVEGRLRADGAVVTSGGEYDRWDLTARTGFLGRARLRMGLEEHGEGRQLARFRAWPLPSRGGSVAAVVMLVLALVAAFEGSWGVAVVLALGGALVAAALLRDCAIAMGLVVEAVEAAAPLAPVDQHEQVRAAAEAAIESQLLRPERLGHASQRSQVAEPGSGQKTGAVR